MRKLKLYLKIVIFTLISINCFAQTVIFNENFGTTAGAFPSGWTTTGTAGTTGWNTFTTGPSSGYTGSSGSGQFRTGSSATSMTLTFSNNLSTAGYTNITVIWGARRTSTQTAATFEWSADGTVWDTIPFTDVAANSTWGLVNSDTNISLPSGAEGISNLQFRWTATVDGASGYRIDDFIVSGTPVSSVPSKLSITSVNAGNSPTVNNSFSISVQSQDTGSLASNVTANTDFTLSVATGTGALSGTVTGSILAGTNSTTVNGILYNTVESDVSITATVTAGDVLTAGTSSLFNVLDTANHLLFVNVPANGFTATNLVSFTVEALRADNFTDINYSGNITIVKLSGTGNITGTLSTNAIAGVASFSDIQFDIADTYTISAASGNLNADTSGNIVISDSVIAAILPTSYDWTPSSNYPQGWTNSGLTFYTSGNLAPNSGKFDTQDDNIIVFYDTSACIVEYYLKGNGLTIPYQLDLMESADGNTYTVLTSHSDTQNSLISTYQYFSASPDLASRYIKFNYTVKTGGNIAIDDVLIDLCLDINTKDINRYEITVYPNPVKHILHINNINQNSSVSIINILGESVYTSLNIKMNKLSVNMENILQGIYILVTKNSNGDITSFRFIKE